jgi:hypothetical protein
VDEIKCDGWPRVNPSWFEQNHLPRPEKIEHRADQRETSRARARPEQFVGDRPQRNLRDFRINLGYQDFLGI